MITGRAAQLDRRDPGGLGRRRPRMPQDSSVRARQSCSGLQVGVPYISSASEQADMVKRLRAPRSSRVEVLRAALGLDFRLTRHPFPHHLLAGLKERSRANEEYTKTESSSSQSSSTPTSSRSPGADRRARQSFPESLSRTPFSITCRGTCATGRSSRVIINT